MALYDGFFDAVLDESTGKYDREYSGEDFVGYFENIVGSGVCVYENPDSFRPLWTAQGVLLAPGALFIRGYYLHNRPGPHEDPAEYRGYLVPLEGEGEQAVLAHLDLAVRRIELLCQPRGQDIPEDSLVLCYADPASGTVADTRQDPDLCGILDAAGDLSGKVAYAVDYIDNQVEGRLQEAREQIAAKEAELDGKIAQVAAEVEKITPPPVGTVQFTASQNVGPEWLLCDGSFVNEADYPELVAALGKHVPKPEDFTEIAAGRLPANLTNGVIQDGKLWTYSFDQGKLLGLDLSTKAITEIPVTGTDELYAPAMQSIYLSMANGGVFLAQYKESDALANKLLIYTNYAFSPGAASLPMTRLTWDKPELGGISKEDMVPYVSYNAFEEAYQIAVGVGSPTSRTVPFTYSLKWKEGNQILPYPTYKDYQMTAAKTIYPYASGNPAGKAGYQRKAQGELLYLSNDVTLSSTPKKLYSIQSSASMPAGDQTLRQQLAVATETAALTAVEKTGASGQFRVVFLQKNGSKTSVSVSVNAGVYSRVFEDAAVYVGEMDLWLIFVGTGLLFTSDLANAARYGFLDTTEVLGVITRNGFLEYDSQSRILYIMGQDTQNVVKVGAFQMPPLYNYANDGA